MLLRLLHILHRTEETFIFFLLGLMVLLSGSQILLRNLWDSGIAWGDPLLRVLVLWVGMLGAMLASRHNQHIRIDLLSRYLPPLWKHYSAVVTSLFSAVVCALLAWHSGRFVMFEWQDGAVLFDDVPSWLAESVMPLGFTIIALRFALLGVHTLRRGHR